MQLTLQDAELKALIRLLDDPDQDVYSNVSDRLVSFGKKVVPILENEWEYQHQDSIQKRIEHIIDEIEFDHCAFNLENWVVEYPQDLLKGTLIAGSFQYPQSDFDLIENIIERFRKDVWLELNENLTSLEKVRVINHILFDVHHIRSNHKYRNSHQSYFLQNLLPEGSGSPTVIALLYKIIADKLELPIVGIDLPHHFILGYKDIHNDTENDMLFYINPFSKGAVFGRGELERYIEKMQLEIRVEDLKSIGNVKIIERLLVELKACYQELGKYKKLDQVNKLVQVLRASNK